MDEAMVLNFVQAVEGQRDHGALGDTCVTTSLISPRSDDSTASAHCATAPSFTPSDGDTDVSGSPGRTFRAGAEALEKDRASKENHMPCSDDAESRDFYICVNKIDNPQLGIDVKQDGHISLLIKSVSACGLVGTWNQDNPHLEVHAGDHIITVNGISGSAADMLRECRRCQVLSMRLVSNATRGKLGALVSVSRGSRCDRRSKRLQVCSLTRVARAACIRTQALRQSAEEPVSSRVPPLDELVTRDTLEVSSSVGNDDVFPHHEEKTQCCVPESFSTSSPFVPKLSLANLLPAGVSNCPGQSNAVASRASSQHASRTKLKSSAPAFVDFGESLFEATLACMTGQEAACWDFYEKGFQTSGPAKLWIDDFSQHIHPEAKCDVSLEVPIAKHYCPGELLKKYAAKPITDMPPVHDDASECSTADTLSPHLATLPFVSSNTSSDAVEQVPIEATFQLPSIGSQGHNRGLCRPCGFAHSAPGCEKGFLCE